MYLGCAFLPSIHQTHQQDEVHLHLGAENTKIGSKNGWDTLKSQFLNDWG